jgi:murein L,D-transpeptidase YafK
MRDYVKCVNHRGHRGARGPLCGAVSSVDQAFCILAKITKSDAALLFSPLFILAMLALAIPCAASDGLAKDARANKVLVLKSERILELLDHGKVLKKYKVALGSAPVGKKQKQGDHKTPEGLYILDRRNEHSQFYRALHISYPNADDRMEARKAGISPGGDIMIHGLPSGMGWIGSRHRLRDWTDGCIAVTDEEMDEIWRAVADGTPIEIRP